MYNLDGSINWEALPIGARSGLYSIGTEILVSHKAFEIEGCTPRQWFKATICIAPYGNRYRWYDPFIHFVADFDLYTSDPVWGNRKLAYIGRVWQPYLDRDVDYWAIPVKEYIRKLKEASHALSNLQDATQHTS